MAENKKKMKGLMLDKGFCEVRLKKSLEDITKMLGEAGLNIEIVGVTAVAGLLSSEALKDDRTGEDVMADEAFEFFDADGNGVIQRGDIEVFLNLAGIQDIEEVGKQAGEILEGVDKDGDGSISRQEWRDAWQNCASLRKFRHELNDDSLRAEMVAKYGKNGPEHIPLYAFGNKMSFYH